MSPRCCARRGFCGAAESRPAFEAYEANSELKAKFAGERAPFEKYMRIERFSGEVEKSYAA
jgi:hypothetical protein